MSLSVFNIWEALYLRIIELIILSIGLAMDAFSVSICKGLSLTKMKIKDAIIVGLYFGIFQALMPIIGYSIGIKFYEQITNVDHWIAFILLFCIGINMIKDAIINKEEEKDDSLKTQDMLVLAVATSIDALAVGITFAFLNVNIILACTLIGVITFAISIIGVKIGNVFGNRYEKKAQILGGIVLILVGFKILIEHLVR